MIRWCQILPLDESAETTRWHTRARYRSASATALSAVNALYTCHVRGRGARVVPLKMHAAGLFLTVVSIMLNTCVSGHLPECDLAMVAK